MRSARSISIGLGLVLALALALRIGAAVWWDARAGQRFYFGDSDSYWVLAGHIARGEPYEYGGPTARIFRTPGYPLLLAPLFLVHGGAEPTILAARLLGALLGTATVTGVFLLGRQLFDPRAGLLAALIAAVYPGAIAQSVFVLSEGPFCTAMIFELAATWSAWRATTAAQTAGFAALAGALAAIATLIRPSWLLFAPVVALGGLLLVRDRRQLVLTIALLAAFAATMAPWWARNYAVSGRFVPTSLQMGASLYDGLNPRATGASDLSATHDIVQGIKSGYTAEQLRADRTIEAQVDRALRDSAIAWAANHPADVLRLAAIKFARLWNVWPNEPAFRALPLRLLTAATYLPIMLLAIYGTVRLWPAERRDPRRAAIVLCWLPALYLTALHVVFVSSLRYREPAMLTLAVLAAAAMISAFAPPRVLAPKGAA